MAIAIGRSTPRARFGSTIFVPVGVPGRCAGNAVDYRASITYTFSLMPKPGRIANHTFRGKRYRVIWKKPRPKRGRKGHELIGLCEPPDWPDKRIWISPKKKGPLKKLHFSWMRRFTHVAGIWIIYRGKK